MAVLNGSSFFHQLSYYDDLPATAVAKLTRPDVISTGARHQEESAAVYQSRPRCMLSLQPLVKVSVKAK